MSWEPIISGWQCAILNEEDKERLHLATLEVLRRTGVRVHHERALALLEQAGCPISDGNLVRIPPHLVEQAVRTAPPSITIYDRLGQPAMYLEGRNVYFGTGSDLPNVRDVHTGERRPARKADVADAARVCDALPHISFIMSMALPSDVPIAVSDVHSFEAMLTHSTKPIVYTAHDAAGLELIVAMAAAMRQDMEDLRRRPFLILYAEPTTPLQHSFEAVDKLLFIARSNLPAAYVPGSISGAAAPITPAGAMVVTNAELLSGLVIAQLERPGAPCIFGSGTGPLDMRTMVNMYAAPEFMLMTSAMAEMGRYYRLPTWGFAGCSDAKLFDQQAAAEGALWIMAAALSGANLVHDVGYIESGLTCSLEMLVTMNEVIDMVRHTLRRVDMSPEALALEVIDQVGPGGDYLSTEHTLRHCREGWLASLFDKWGYAEWEAAGGLTAGERANQKARQILETHRPAPLSDAQRRRLDEILERAERRLSPSAGASSPAAKEEVQ